MFTFSMTLGITAAVLACAAPAIAQPLVEVFPLECGAAYVQVNGTPGNDAISLRSCPTGELFVVRASGTDIQVALVPASGAAVIVVDCGAGNDCVDTTGLSAIHPCEVYAGEGNDLVVCGPGADLVLGEAGDDAIWGGEGGDTLFGGPGRGDCLFGGGGEDMLADEDGVDQVSGGDGDDAISIMFDAAWDNNGTASDVRCSARIRAGAGNDYVMITVLGPPLLLSINGDGGTAANGPIDLVEITGLLAPGSSTPNFETVSKVMP